MKKFIAVLSLMLCVCMCLSAACAEITDADLKAGKAILRTMYKGATETTPADYEIVGVLNIGGVEYPIEWTTDNESVKIVPGENKMVTVDVDENNPEEVTYVLTGTIKNAAGESVSVSFNHKVPASLTLEDMSYGEIVAAAYTLEDGAAMPAPTVLEGVISSIDTPWSDEYQNITVTIVCDGKEDQKIQCYRLAGEGAKDLAEGQAIAVAGTIKNYKGTIEFDKGCQLIPADSAADVRVAMGAYTLEDGLAQDKAKNLTGEIVSIDTAWSDEYQNITVTIVPGGMADYKIQCYRLTGEGAKDLAVGDVITVNGILKNYKGTIEFDKGCTIVK